ncbi:tyrosine-type recombinase/integrase [Salinigranum halophilum]|uniref:tyrosine-type recombinase/integrase n=1 Tax=Salinigranum halophilum TaxID=2565931 RepID=UPI0010A8DDCB|nr:site-specific integrase [Salinigranum halophilum]
MSDDLNEIQESFATAFERNIDPLEQYEPHFQSVEHDPLDFFVAKVPKASGVAQSTLDGYRATFNDWRAFMNEVAGRHPACPSEQHVAQWIRWLSEERGNEDSTITGKLIHLNAAYKFWQKEASFPHGKDFNPVQSAWDSWESNPVEKEEHRTTIEDLRRAVNGVKSIRDRSYVVLGLKLGLRVGEVRNIRLEDIAISAQELNEHYTQMGTAAPVRDRENCIYIPHDRDGNKSLRPRVLPLDAEVRRELRRWLLIRPDADQPWAYLGKTRHEQLDSKDINRAWQEAFSDYGETEKHKPITSHYGRHRFTTYWRVERDLNRDLVKYMRGDKMNNAVAAGDGKFDAIDAYIHTYYEDIEDVYRNEIFRLRLD